MMDFHGIDNLGEGHVSRSSDEGDRNMGNVNVGGQTEGKVDYNDGTFRTDGSSDDQTINGGIHENLAALDQKDVRCMVFETLLDAETFYMNYSKQVGFGVRRRDSRTWKNGQDCMVKWVCDKEGIRNTSMSSLANRKRKAKRETRENCPALFRVNLERNSRKWFVGDFNNDHSHALVPVKLVKFIRCHRSLSSNEKSQVRAFRAVGVKSNHIVQFLMNQAGGPNRSSFTAKDVHNFIHAERRAEIEGGDANKALGYLQAKCQLDPGFFFNYTLSEDNSLGSLFMADSTSRADYAIFGDVIAFDACYRRNVYNKPLVIIVGINHHRQTIVLGCALLQDERTESYIWLLEQFLVCMSGKKPRSVVTDGDKAMRAAINVQLPEATHRLCSWHLDRNAMREVHLSGFVRDFNQCMHARVSEIEFNKLWDNVVRKYNLHNNDWMKQRYNDRKMWAECYLKGQFFGGVRTTSRCEGMHAFMNYFLTKKLNLFEFIQHYSRALSLVRDNELRADFVSNTSTPFCAHGLRHYQLQAAQEYTQASYNIFLNELMKETTYISSSPMQVDGDKHIYRLVRFSHTDRVRVVVYNTKDQSLHCSCLMMEEWGYPCRHVICVMKQEHLSKMPDGCILKRWSKNAKHGITSISEEGVHISKEGIQNVRYGALHTTCSQVCAVASKSASLFDAASTELNRLLQHMHQLDSSETNVVPLSQFVEVNDPNSSRTKGMHNTEGIKKKQPRKCGECRESGHTKATCPLLQGHTRTTTESSDTPTHMWGESTECLHNVSRTTYGQNYYQMLLGMVSNGSASSTYNYALRPSTLSSPLSYSPLHNASSEECDQLADRQC